MRLLLSRPRTVGGEELPMGTPIAEISLLRTTTDVGYVIDALRRGDLMIDSGDTQPPAVAKAADSTPPPTRQPKATRPLTA